MKISKTLFELVKSLSTEEKRKFSLFTSLQKGDKNYLKVYEELNKLIAKDKTKLDVEKLDIRLRRRGITNANLSKNKNYLLDHILNTTRSIYEARHAKGIITALLSEARVLERKGLYDNCLKKLEEVRKVGYKFEIHFVLVEALEMERLLCLRRSINDVEGKLSKINQAISKQIKLLEVESVYRQLHYSIVALYRQRTRARDQENLDLIKSHLDNSLLDINANPPTFFSKVSYFLSLALLSLLQGDKITSNAYYKQLLDVWLGHPHFKEEYPVLYIIYTTNYLIGSHTIRDYEPFEKYIEELENIPVLYFDDKAEAFQNIYFVKQLYYMNFEIFHFKGDKLAAANGLAREIEEGLDKYELRITKSREISFYHNTTILFFALADYPEALYWIAKTRQLKPTSQQQDIQLFARLMQLLIRVEQGNSMHIDKEFKSFDYHLIKRGLTEGFEGVIAEYLKLYANKKQPKSEVFKGLQQKLEAYKFQGLPYYDEISIWVKSKIKNRSFFEIMREYD